LEAAKLKPGQYIGFNIYRISPNGGAMREDPTAIALKLLVTRANAFNHHQPRVDVHVEQEALTTLLAMSRARERQEAAALVFVLDVPQFDSEDCAPMDLYLCIRLARSRPVHGLDPDYMSTIIWTEATHLDGTGAVHVTLIPPARDGRLAPIAPDLRELIQEGFGLSGSEATRLGNIREDYAMSVLAYLLGYESNDLALQLPDIS
jgi:hypothetical protein